MSVLTDRSTGKRVLATGNDAIARGALEAGIGFFSTYPGTPASGIGDAVYEVKDKLNGLYFEYSVNEKVAFEGAIGAAWCGIRSLCAMKLPGVNVISDPLHSIAYFGVKGLVFVSGSDPGIQSSATEQDNRWFGVHAHFPVIEPGTVAEARDFTKIAFEISDKYGVPCMINIANDLCHGAGIVQLGPLPKTFPGPGKFEGPLVKHAVRSVGLHKAAVEKKARIGEDYASSSLNRLIPGKGTTGIITSGLPFGYTMEALAMLGVRDMPVLKLGLLYPIAPKLLSDFAKGLTEIIIVEELEPFLETFVKQIAFDLGSKVRVMGKDLFPWWGALSPNTVMVALAKHLNRPLPASFQEVSAREADRAAGKGGVTIAERIPTLCIGCSHRGSAWAVKKAMAGKGVIGSDIGCYGMLRREPWQLTDWSLCMGGGIGVAQGMSHKLANGPLISFIGDSTFFHAGLEPVLNAAWQDADMTLVILDNRWTAMTGHQPTQTSNLDVMGRPMKSLDLQEVLKGLGVKQVFVADAFDPPAMAKLLKQVLAKPGFKVVISEGECILQTQRRQRLTKQPAKVFVIKQELCSHCGLCADFTCPAVLKLLGTGKKANYEIDKGLCAGCGACVTICPKKAIVEIT